MSGTTVYIPLLINLFLLIIALVALHFYSRRMKEELKRNAEPLKQTEQYRDLFENTDEGISHTDLKGRFVFINSAAAKILGFDKPEDLYDKGIHAFQFYADPSEAESIREQLTSGKSVQNRVVQIKSRNSRLSYVLVSIHTRFDAKGNPAGFESIGHDVTDRVMLEVELSNYSDNLEALVRKKTDEIIGLERKKFGLEKLAAVGDAVASLVRLMSVPLSKLRSCFDLIRKRHTFDKSTERMMDLLEEEGIRFRRLLDDSLHFATPENLKPIRQDLHPILDKVAMQYDKEFKKKGIVFRREYATAIPPVSVDSDRLTQVIVNLLQNAKEALRDGDGEIVLKTGYSPNEAFLRISVEDNGVGVREQDMKRLFDPFFTKKPEGIGLGLPVVRKIIEAHDGTVSIESRPGWGTRVRIELPTEPLPSQQRAV